MCMHVRVYICVCVRKWTVRAYVSWSLLRTWACRNHERLSAYNAHRCGARRLILTSVIISLLSRGEPSDRKERARILSRKINSRGNERGPTRAPEYSRCFERRKQKHNDIRSSIRAFYLTCIYALPFNPGIS